MRCVACNAILSQKDESRVGAFSNLPLDLCTPCVKETNIEFIENPIADEDSHTDPETDAVVDGEDDELLEE